MNARSSQWPQMVQYNHSAGECERKRRHGAGLCNDTPRRRAHDYTVPGEAQVVAGGPRWNVAQRNAIDGPSDMSL